MEGCLDIMGSAAIAEAAVLQQMARRDEGNSVRRFSSSAFAHDDHEAQWHGHVRRRRLSQRSGGQGRENSAVQRGIAGGLDENGIFYSALRIQVNFDLDRECDGVDLRIRQQPLIDFRLRTLPIGPEGGVGNAYQWGGGNPHGPQIQRRSSGSYECRLGLGLVGAEDDGGVRPREMADQSGAFQQKQNRSLRTEMADYGAGAAIFNQVPV